MKLGTRSVLYGYHCFLIHWFFVFLGWMKLYGVRSIYIGERKLTQQEQREREAFTGTTRGFFHDWTVPVRARITNPRLWVAFFIHDLGYWGLPNMDGPEGEAHPEWAARKMRKWFGEPWGTFALYHSRFYAKRDNADPSPLCFADKLAIVYMPGWLYLPMIHATGEVHEYMKNATRQTDAKEKPPTSREWLRGVKDYVRRWVAEHKDGRRDTWTPASGYDSDDRATVDSTGVWK